MRLERINALYTGADGRQHTYDMLIPENFNGTCFLFMHGFMGFKDWGCWNLFMDHFTQKGYGFCRFNITHNGTTPAFQKDFVDEEAFGNDTYWKEWQDLNAMIGICREVLNSTDKLVLIGHSRGGGMVIVGGLDPRVDAVVSLAGISSIERRFPVGKELEEWRNSGVRYVHNSRTGQDLPQYFVQYEEFDAHRAVLDIHKSCRQLNKPVLLIHGDADHSVKIQEGQELAEWLSVDLQVIQGAEHTFGASHPWIGKELPDEMLEVCRMITQFVDRLD